MRNLALVTVGSLFVLGCQSESTPEQVVVETSEAVIETMPVSFNLDGAPTAELHVPDMMCQFSCAAKVKEVLTAQTGVKEVKIDFDAKKAIVAVDESEFDGEASVAALVDYQFSNTKLIASE